MTLNGWFQILLFLGVILAITAPLGRFHDARVQPRADVARSGAAPDRAADLPD